MSSVYVIAGSFPRKNDTNSLLEVQLCEDNGLPLDLTNATVRVFLRNGLNSLQVNGSCTIVSPNSDGRVRYAYSNTDLNATGVYKAEWQVTQSSMIRTFPSPGVTRVIITEELG